MARGGGESFKRRINRGTGTVLPIVILGIAGYSVWVVVKLLCVDYLIGETDRPSTAAAIIAIFFLVFIPTWMAYLRFLSTLLLNPGFIPFGAGRTKSRPTGPLRGHLKDDRTGLKPAVDLKSSTPDSSGSDGSRSKESSTTPALTTTDANYELQLDKASILAGTLAPPPGLHDFYRKDIFICDSAGLPVFCAKCHNWKPDRTHHCSEIGRCVRRMDHFCPWMGGVVSETNMKFFLQFGFYAMVSCGYILAVMIWAIVDQKRYYAMESHNSQGRDVPNTNFVATTAVAGMFTLMAFGVLANWGKLSAWNQTTVESLGRQYFLAVLLPPPRADGTPSNTSSLPTITYPLATKSTASPASPEKKNRKHHRRHPSSGSHAARNAAPRTFAIIQTGHHNPWDLKSRLDNLKTILGTNYLDWIIPIRLAPCTRHDDLSGDYPWGPAVEKLCLENGIDMPVSRRSSP